MILLINALVLKGSRGFFWKINFSIHEIDFTICGVQFMVGFYFCKIGLKVICLPLI